MERSIQSQLEQAIRNQEEQVGLRDKEITRLRAQNAELLAALETGYSDLRGRLVQYAQGQFGADYESAVKYVENGVPVLDQMRAAIAKAKGSQS